MSVTEEACHGVTELRQDSFFHVFCKFDVRISIVEVEEGAEGEGLLFNEWMVRRGKLTKCRGSNDVCKFVCCGFRIGTSCSRLAGG